MTQWDFKVMDSHRNKSTDHKLSLIWPININHDGPLPVGEVVQRFRKILLSA